MTAIFRYLLNLTSQWKFVVMVPAITAELDQDNDKYKAGEIETPRFFFFLTAEFEACRNNHYTVSQYSFHILQSTVISNGVMAFCRIMTTFSLLLVIGSFLQS